jgi:hypothetical protein
MIISASSKSKLEWTNAFKEAIKKKTKSDFDHVCTDSLVLWNVNIPSDKLYAEDIDKLLEKEKPLMSLEVLTDIFSKPPDGKHRHIIVKLPSVNEFTDCRRHCSDLMIGPVAIQRKCSLSISAEDVFDRLPHPKGGSPGKLLTQGPWAKLFNTLQS